MNNLKAILFGAGLAAFSVTSIAQTQVTNTFESGAAASAAEVNTNFADLVSAIDALSTEVDALQAAAPTNDVAGRNYILSSTWQFIEDQTTRTDPGPNSARLFNFGHTEADISFSNIGTMTLGTETNIERELIWDTTGNAGVSIGTLQEEVEVTNATVDYTQTGNFVEVPDFGAELYASKDGSILIWSNYRQELTEEGDTRFEGGRVILIELETASPN